MSGAGGGPSGLRGRPTGRLTSRPSSAGNIARPRWRRRRTRGASARASGSAAGSGSGSGGSRASSPRPRRRSAGGSRSASGTEVSPSPASAPRGPPPALLTGLSPQRPATVAGAAPAPRRKALRRGAGAPRAASRRARGSRPKVLGAGSPPDKEGGGFALARWLAHSFLSGAQMQPRRRTRAGRRKTAVTADPAAPSGSLPPRLPSAGTPSGATGALLSLGRTRSGGTANGMAGLMAHKGRWRCAGGLSRGWAGLVGQQELRV